MASWDVEAKGQCTLKQTPEAEAALKRFKQQFYKLGKRADRFSFRSGPLHDSQLRCEFEIATNEHAAGELERLFSVLCPHLVAAIEVAFACASVETAYYGPAHLVEDAEIAQQVSDLEHRYRSLSDLGKQKLMIACFAVVGSIPRQPD